jgi:hypothetical protein
VLFDYFTPEGLKVEVKEDHAAARTGNFYLEYAQTFNGWLTYQWSGLFLAFEQADQFLVFVQYKAYLFETKTLYAHEPFFQDDTPIRVTKAACNGNKPGAFSAGIVVPMEEITPFASQVFERKEGVWTEQSGKTNALTPLSP